MKIKIRGLVFVGFAAAVFAQSALAEITDSDKTVTSKTYVDTNFQNIVQKDKATGEGTTASPYATTINANSSNDTYPTSQNVYKFVEGQIVSTAGGIDGDVTKHTQKIAVFESGYTPTGTAESPSTADLEHVTGWKLIVPDSVVAESGSDIWGSNGEGPASTDYNDLTTAKAVYDFVNGSAGTGFQRKLTSGEKPSLGVYNADGTSVWKQATGGTYVAVAEPQGGTSITFDIDSTKIATIGADDPSTQAVEVSEITADSTKLTTGKAVYEFVTEQVNEAAGDFQPKLTAAQASALAGYGTGTDAGHAIAVGYRAYDSDNPTADNPSTWKVFGARANGSGTDNDYHLSYLEVQPGTSIDERDKYWVDIKSGALAKNAGAISDGGTATGAAAAQTADKLATAKAVYDYAVKKQWDASDEGKHLVIDSTGAVVLSENANPDIPGADDMPSECSSANGGKVCALVAYYDANAGGTGVGGVKYEWTVMAPTGNNG